MQDLKDKVAFITGGASGIGLGMARAFVAGGMRVVIADLRDDHLAAALALFEANGQRARVHGLELDVTDRDALARAADEAEHAFGPVQLVCNNAGVNFFAPIDESSYDDWDWLLGVNLGGVVNGVQTFVPRLKAQGLGGHIVNTASMAAFIASPNAGIYTATKFAVRGLTESLRWSLAPLGIGVSMLCPGLVNTQIHRSAEIRPARFAQHSGRQDADVLARVAELQPCGMDPLDVAARVLQGVRNNDLYIFPHGEFREELQEIFGEILGALPAGSAGADPRRLAFEQRRRENLRKAKTTRH
ncbi:MAG: SDR family NAD(P)-dependent oxidoreductase [Gammaproteobacteria bacterium]|nr:SDR family NAD(P)-dependent oxidoreductase [Gammaproteobacteria bacterium]